MMPFPVTQSSDGRAATPPHCERTPPMTATQPTHTATPGTATPDTATPGAGAGRTRLLLTGLAVAGPLWTVVALGQAATRAGFDLTRHPLSLLSTGDLGWLQITNFVLAAVLTAAGAAGLRRALAAHPVAAGRRGCSRSRAWASSPAARSERLGRVGRLTPRPTR